MNNLFLARVLISFVVGASFITLLTIVAERCGSKLGGIVAGLPGNSAVSLIFIALAQNLSTAALAAKASVMAYIGYGVFLLAYAYPKAWPITPRLLVSLIIWAIFSPLIVNQAPDQLSTTLVLLISAALSFAVVFEFLLRIHSSSGIKIKYTKKALTNRALASGLTVASAVVLSSLFGPQWGGIMTAFPVATVASFIILNQSIGIQATRSLAKTILLSGMLVTGLYSASISLSYPAFGLIAGTVISYFFAIFLAITFYYIIKHFLN